MGLGLGLGSRVMVRVRVPVRVRVRVRVRPLVRKRATQYKHIDSSVPCKTKTVRVKGKPVKGPGIVRPRDFTFTNLTLAPCEDEDSLISWLTQTIDIIHEANRYAITHNLI